MADVTLEDGREVTAHVANPGSMMGMADAGMTVWLEQNDDPKRKLKYSWKLVAVGNTLVGVDKVPPTALSKKRYSQVRWILATATLSQR